MLLDIAVEEFGHLEMVGRLIELHTKGVKPNIANDSPLFAARGKGPHFLDSLGVTWSASYINEGGDVVRDLRADIAAEAGARQTYEALVNMAPGQGSKKALLHFLPPEIEPTNMFMNALEPLRHPPTPHLPHLTPH